MTTLDLIKTAWRKAQGEEFTDEVGSETWDYLLGLANYYIPVWATQYGVDWVSLYNPDYSVGTVTATDSFKLSSDDVRKLSDQKGDYVRITHTNGTSYTDYTIVPANQLRQKATEQACAKLGATLKFSRPFVSTDAQFGGKITAPIYGNPPLLKNEKSIVPVDNEAWLACMMAYDIALHDILRKDTASNLLSEANDIFRSMKSDNNRAQENMINEVDLSWIGGGN